MCETEGQAQEFCDQEYLVVSSDEDSDTECEFVEMSCNTEPGINVRGQSGIYGENEGIPGSTQYSLEFLQPHNGSMYDDEFIEMMVNDKADDKSNTVQAAINLQDRFGVEETEQIEDTEAGMDKNEVSVNYFICLPGGVDICDASNIVRLQNKECVNQIDELISVNEKNRPKDMREEMELAEDTWSRMDTNQKSVNSFICLPAGVDVCDVSDTLRLQSKECVNETDELMYVNEKSGYEDIGVETELAEDIESGMGKSEVSVNSFIYISGGVDICDVSNTARLQSKDCVNETNELMYVNEKSGHPDIEEESNQSDPLGQVFAYNSSFCVQTKMEEGEGPLTCDVCSMEITDYASLRQHKGICIEDRDMPCRDMPCRDMPCRDMPCRDMPCRCDVCSMEFSQLTNLKTHISICKEKWSLLNNACGSRFTDCSTLRKRRQTHREEKCFQCVECGFTCTTKRGLTLHQRVHMEEKPYKCDVCSEGFISRTVLNTHIRTHAGKRLHKCNICGKDYRDISRLRKHKSIHSGEKPYKCDVCNERFCFRATLKSHRQIHTGGRLHKCEICGNNYRDSHRLRKHKRTHAGEKPYKCDVCGKGFVSSRYLPQHKRIHTGEKPYKCDICGKGFSTSSYLPQHKRIHTGEKPYKCDVCDKGFISSPALKVHIQIHTGQRLHKCDLCGKDYRDPSSLRYHKKLHTGRKPCKCDICGKRFYRSSYLPQHKRIHTGEKPYKCDVCSDRFCSRAALNTHAQIHTGDRL